MIPNALFHNYYNLDIFHKIILSYTIIIARKEQRQTNISIKTKDYYFYLYDAFWRDVS